MMDDEERNDTVWMIQAPIQGAPGVLIDDTKLNLLNLLSINISKSICSSQKGKFRGRCLNDLVASLVAQW